MAYCNMLTQPTCYNSFLPYVWQWLVRTQAGGASSYLLRHNPFRQDSCSESGPIFLMQSIHYTTRLHVYIHNKTWTLVLIRISVSAVPLL